MIKKIITLFIVLFLSIFLVSCDNNKHSLIETNSDLKDIRLDDIESIEYSIDAGATYKIFHFFVSYDKVDITNLWNFINKKVEKSTSYSGAEGGECYLIIINTKEKDYSLYLRDYLNDNDFKDTKYGFTIVDDNGELDNYIVGGYEEIELLFSHSSYDYYKFDENKRNYDVYDKNLEKNTTINYLSEIIFEEMSSSDYDYNNALYIIKDAYLYFIYILDNKTFYISNKYENHQTNEIVESIYYKPVCNKYYRIVSDIDFSSLFD